MRLTAALLLALTACARPTTTAAPRAVREPALELPALCRGEAFGGLCRPAPSFEPPVRVDTNLAPRPAHAPRHG